MAKIRRNDAAFSERRPAPQPQEVPEAPAQRASEKKRHAGRKNGAGYTVAVLLCLVVFLLSAGMLVKRFWEDRQAENEFADLRQMIDTTEPAEEDGITGNEAKFASLRQQNQDFLGWISIEDTNLDFPVMYAPDNKDYYLRHDFQGEYSVYGVPYLDEKTTMTAEHQSENLVIYGHNMKTGTIFGCLTGYKKASYYEAHPVIRFDTLYGDASYEVFAAFAIDVAADTSFVYNQYVDLDEEAYDRYVEEVLSRSDVDSGIRPQYGEQLLTLSTCEYSTDNGRYVVVARRLPA